MFGWNFPDNQGGVAAGINDGAVDTFSGHVVQSLIRELIQNSLDAKSSPTAPVKVKFSLETVQPELIPEATSIVSHLKMCLDVAKQQNLDGAISFYENALVEIKKKSPFQMLCVHDENTTGLTGPISDPWGSWFALTKGAGISQKDTDGSLGSFGHGSKVSFALSNTRTVFYHSKVIHKGRVQTRFQGKAILQTHRCPYSPDRYTQGTGFFGEIDKLSPLIDNAVPKWSNDLREQFSTQVGTSIFIPFANIEGDQFDQFFIYVVANFFYAIITEELIVEIGDKIIDRESLENYYNESLLLVKADNKFYDNEALKDKLASVETLINYDFHNAQEISGFGKVLWWLRVRKDIGRRDVAISRRNGMLITRTAPQLIRFPNTKPFDMFVCVKGDVGSEILRKLENPSHTNFQFDRVRDLDEKRKLIKKYRQFTSKIRDVISRHAAIEDVSEQTVAGLSSIFGQLTETRSDNPDSVERGSVMQVLGGTGLGSKKQHQRVAELDYIEDMFALKRKDKAQKKLWLRNAEKMSKAEVANISAENLEEIKRTQTSIKKFAKNLRIVRLSDAGQKAIMYFDAPSIGQYYLTVHAVGELSTTPVQIKYDDEFVDGVSVFLSTSSRQKLELTFDRPVDRFVLEVVLHEIN